MKTSASGLKKGDRVRPSADAVRREILGLREGDVGTVTGRHRGLAQHQVSVLWDRHRDSGGKKALTIAELWLEVAK